MRVVLAVVWLMVLCLPVSAAETVQRFNTNGDGQADQIIHYDGEGRIARVLQNLDADGKPHAWMEYKAGVLASSAFDTSNNGQADQWHHYQADGHVTRIEYDQNGDGRPDQWGALQARQRRAAQGGERYRRRRQRGLRVGDVGSVREG